MRAYKITQIAMAHSSLCRWAGVSEQIATMCSSYFVIRNYKQDSDFGVSGVLQLAKTGPPVTKNFPFLRLFLSDVMMMARKFYTPCDINCTFLNILTVRARNVAHFLLELANNKLEKEFVRACPKPKLENYES